MTARILLFLVAIAFAGCNGSQPDPWNGTTKLRVATTFAPIHCFALNVAGDNADVRSILSTQGPHDASIPTGQATMLAKSDVLFANGLKVDSRLVSKLTSSFSKGKPIIVKLGDGIPKNMLLEGVCGCCLEDDEDHKHEEGHVHTDIDGHVWLGIPQAKNMIEGMGKVMEQQRKELDKQYVHPPRAAEYMAKLDKLQADGKAMLKDKKDRTILPFHGSLAYFAKSFDLKLIDPIQEVPGQEPTAKHLKEIIDKCVAENVRVIAVEPQFGADTSAKVLFDELKKRGLDPVIVVIDPLETATEAEFGPDWYETKMRANLTALAGALK